MMTAKRLIFSLLILLAMLAPAAAEDMNYLMSNKTSRAIVVELVSQDRDYVWPGGGKVYLLEPGERKSVPIECNGGERICYAAWVNGDDSRAYGIGPEHDRRCDECCMLCAAGSPEEVMIGGE